MKYDTCSFQPAEPLEGHVAAIRFNFTGSHSREIHLTEQDAHDVINVIRAQLIVNSNRAIKPQEQYE